MKKINEIEILKFFNENNINDWILEEKDNSVFIKKTFKFNKYRDAITFVNKVGFIAESLNHHPKIIIDYKNVNLSLTTNEVGNNITNLDVNFIEELEKSID